jgi:hypothetical protein
MKETPTAAADPDYVEKYLICQKWDIQNWSVNADGMTSQLKFPIYIPTL